MRKFNFHSFHNFSQNGRQGVNGETQDHIDYAAKNHELQTIIEKQVNLYLSLKFTCGHCDLIINSSLSLMSDC